MLLGLVIAGKTMNPRLNQDKTELGVLIFPVGLEMLANGNRLFDEVPKVLRDGWAKSYPQTKRYTQSVKCNGEETRGTGEKERSV